MKLLYKVLLLVLVYLLIYKPEFIFFPSSINTCLGLLGFMSYFFDRITRTAIYNNANISVLNIIKYAIPFTLVAIFSVLLNGTNDFYYVKYILSLVLAYFANYLIAVVSYKCYGTYDIKIFIRYLVFATWIYLLVAFAMSINGSLNNALLSLLKKDENQEAVLELTFGGRLHALGASYFTAGIICGYVFILVSYNILRNSYTLVQLLYYYVFLVVLFVIGMMLARTTLVGSLIGCSMIVVSLLRSKSKVFKTVIISLIIIGIIIITLGINVSSDLKNQLQNLSDFAFEMFINYNETGTFSTSSTNHLQTMYDAIPNSDWTWIIGDAQWGTTSEYYKGTDVGYLRSIWYFGLLGLFALIYYYYNVLHEVFDNRGFHRTLVYILFLYVLILNGKGSCDLFFYVIPIYFCWIKT